MLDPNKISKIGIGTWGIGGFLEKDSSIDAEKQVKALKYMLDQGMNFVELNMFYAQGYSVEIFAEAIKRSKLNREDIFICQAVYVKQPGMFDIRKKELERLLEILGTNYVDSLQVSMANFHRTEPGELYAWLDEGLANGKTRYVSVTNQNLKFLKDFHQRYEDKLFSQEVAFNFEVRTNEKIGNMKYANKNGIKTVVYQPIRRNRTALMNWPIVVELAEKYGKTQNQILINWIISKGYLPLTKSETIEHIDSHLEALEFTIDPQDIARLDEFEIPGYTEPEIDWDMSGDGVELHMLSNEFESLYQEQTGNK